MKKEVLFGFLFFSLICLSFINASEISSTSEVVFGTDDVDKSQENLANTSNIGWVEYLLLLIFVAVVYIIYKSQKTKKRVVKKTIKKKKKKNSKKTIKKKKK